MLSPYQVMNVLVSLEISYEKIIRLYPICGPYSIFVPIFIYTIFASLRQITIGRTCSICFTFVFFYLSSIFGSTDEFCREFTILLVLLVGISEYVMGILRLVWLIRFISHYVISGANKFSWPPFFYCSIMLTILLIMK